MRNRKKTCGSCSNWIKLAGFNGKGLCNPLDISWIPSDHIEKGCKAYSAKRYTREKNSKINVKDVTYGGDLI